MNVYVVNHRHGTAVFATEALAVAFAEKMGVETVDEFPVVGAEAPRPRVQVNRPAGHESEPLAPPTNGRLYGPDGSELIAQPGPVPENRRPPLLPSLGTCTIHGVAFDVHGHCPRCLGQYQATVGSWPQNQPAKPTPGAEGM